MVLDRTGAKPHGWGVTFALLVLFAAALSFIIVGVLAVLAGCAKPATDVATYEAEQLACIDRAKTRAEADTCRDSVKLRYGRDAGHE